MDCERYKENLSAAALGAPEPRHEAEFAAHLAACAACRAALDEERRGLDAIDRCVAASVAAEPSREFAARVRRRLGQERLPTRLSFAAWVPVAAGALAILALVALWLARRSPTLPGRTGPTQTAGIQQRPPGKEPARAGKTPGATHSALPIEQAATPRGKRPAFRGKGVIAARTAEPEVLVPPGQSEAVLQFYATLGRGRVDSASLLAPAPPLEPAILKIVPLEVAKLDSDSDRRSEP